MIKYIIEGKEYNPIKVGDYGDFCVDNQKCHDCGKEKGQIHDMNCDEQRCPCCHGQLISCPCIIEMYDTENKTKKYIDKRLYFMLLGMHKEYAILKALIECEKEEEELRKRMENK